ncbi:MAG: TetR/AcrR family transcriptional repressor of lmrAB and yxaGH operons [Halioglobus sp.]|jgi:TetR/AcrR family transcriptional repressor of lmrAB and yxaGH operons
MAGARKHKENLVRAAADLFRTQGYSATGLNQILETSGAPKGSLYYYFPEGKESLGAAAVSLAGKAGSKTLQNLKKKADSPADFIALYCNLLAQWMEASEFRSGCPIATTVLETCPQSAVIRSAGAEVFENWIGIIGEVYAETGCSEKEAREHAVACIAAIEGALIMVRASSSVEPLRIVRENLVSRCAQK